MKKWIWIIGILALAVGVGIWMNRTETPPTVRTMVLTPTRVEQTISCNGVVEATDGVGVFAPISCRIREVCVEVGQRVKKGDVLAVVDKEATRSDGGDIATQLAVAALDENIVAPEDGIIVEVGAKAGQTLKLGTSCVLLVRPEDLRVRIAIREKDLRVLREGMTVHITGDGLEQRQYGGVLSDISCTASSSGSSAVVAGVVTPNAGETDTSFRIGLTAKATVVTAVTEKGFLVPYEAILADEQGSYFYIAEKGIAHMYRVTDAVQVASGVLLTDDELTDATVVLEPEKVGGDGFPVMEELA